MSNSNEAIIYRVFVVSILVAAVVAAGFSLHSGDFESWGELDGFQNSKGFGIVGSGEVLEQDGSRSMTGEGEGVVGIADNSNETLHVDDFCVDKYTIGAPLKGILIVQVGYDGPVDMEGFYEVGYEMFGHGGSADSPNASTLGPDWNLSEPLVADSLDDAWSLRENVYQNVLVFGDKKLVSEEYERPAWGHACNYRGYVGHYPEDCPFHVALHELGHLLGYGHDGGGIMSNELCNMDPPGV